MTRVRLDLSGSCWRAAESIEVRLVSGGSICKHHEVRLDLGKSCCKRHEVRLEWVEVAANIPKLLPCQVFRQGLEVVPDPNRASLHVLDDHVQQTLGN
jgi:hypothetical protein